MARKCVIDGGPSRLDLAVGLVWNPQDSFSMKPVVVFQLKNPPSPHLRRMEINIDMIRAKDKVLGLWEFEGHYQHSPEYRVSGRYSTHRRDGEITLLP